MPEEDRMLSTGEAAAILEVSGETLRRWAEAGRITHIRMPSGQLRFRPEDLAAILEPIQPEAS
jgi:excisionase family DNA binding protein